MQPNKRPWRTNRPLLLLTLTAHRRSKGARAARTYQYARQIDGTTDPRPKAPQNESRRKSLTAETYAPMDFPRSLSDSYLQTFLKSLLRLQETMMTPHLKLLMRVGIAGLALIGGYLADISYSDLVPHSFRWRPVSDEPMLPSSGITVHLPPRVVTAGDHDQNRNVYITNWLLIPAGS